MACRLVIEAQLAGLVLNIITMRMQ